MGSGNYESQILEAIQILVDNAVSKAEYDKTIQGTIARCVDKTIGKYIVRYQDSSFYAYSSNTDTTYPSGTSVYVLVPGNNMANNKSIIGTVDHLGPDYVSIIEGENGYEVTGVNTISADGTFGLCSYKEEDIKILYDRDNNVDLVGLDTFGFESYIKKSKSIICGATFKTALTAEQKYRGDYGIVFNLDFVDNATGETVTRPYIVNVDQMTGNPYNYTVASRQYGIFDVDGANFISVKQIYMFSYNFPNVTEDKENDIFVSKIELSAANALDKEAAATCALTFVTPQGTYFDENDLDSDTRTLQAQIRIKGNAIDNDSQNVEYYWFRENNNITTKSEKYNQYGGAGWECLNNYTIVQNETETNEAVVQWTKSGYQYITQKADNVARETTYKCVAVYFDGTILSKTIVIYNYSSNYEISIQSDSGVAFSYDLGKPTLTCLVNGQEETSDAYDYVWSVINSSNQFSVLEETATNNEEYNNAVAARDALLAKITAEQLLTAADQEKLSLYEQVIAQYEYIMRVEENKIHNLKISSITNFSTYKCSVYKSGIFIGTASIIITNSLESDGNYTLVIDNGNQVFKYNENGISPANGSVKNPITIMPLGFTLYDEKGQQINHNVIKDIEWKVPGSDTLIDPTVSTGTSTKNADGTLSYFNLPQLNFRIRENYNANYDKNEIQLIVKHNNKVISAKTNFTFVKEGEIGTNGTDFVCKIVPNGIDGTIAPQYPTVTYNEYTQQYQLNYTPKESDKWFKVQLWHDGELIYEGTESGTTIENLNAKVQWSMLQNNYGGNTKDDSNFTIDTNTAAITFDTTEYSNPANIVKCVINYNNVDYYATLPITIARVSSEDYDIQLLEGSGFRDVMYTPDGQSPAFDNQPFELVVSQIVEGIKNDISHFSTSEFAVDYNWEVKGSVYYSDWQSEVNLLENSLKRTSDLRNQISYKPIDIYNGLCVTNALVCHITRNDEELASIHIPIHFYINRYGNAAMNGWDGNSISLDENGTTILAPQVGAGSKNEDNTFTGVFMGSVKEPGAAKEEHGLFGYNAGQRTITLNSEDGSARFGKAGAGQIIIDPTTGEALLTSGNYDEEAGTGMEINLSEPSIKFGSGKFSIDKDGNVIADSFATREQVEELEESITYFVIDMTTNSILIPSDANNKPLEDKSYVINFYGKFKGKEITSFTEELVSEDISGITTTFGDNNITFTVDSEKAIANAVNEYTVRFKYTDLSNLADVQTYMVEKKISVALAIQGKDGYQGVDGKSAYQIWLEAGNTGTEEEYLASLKGEDGETGKSAYQIAVEEGFEGDEQDWLASLVGKDGAQGIPGEPGTNGQTSYLHIAYANSADGTKDFTTSDGTDMMYMGQYTDFTEADSEEPSDYTWTLIKGSDGEDGAKGETGTGVSAIVEQYYLSTSNTSQTGGEWKTTQDTWTSGKYIWTRSEITWTDGNITYTDPVLADALNQANTTANTANTNASSAVDTANDASSTANAAKTTAENASANADEAKEEAAAATQTANTATDTANNALEQANTANQGLTSLTTVVENNYKDLQGQIDGAIATWFYSYEPNTPDTLPTSEWTTDTIKDQHLGDLFYIIDNEEKAGQCYRYAKIDGVYKWVIVEDVEVAKAIADAANAQATADGKATIYTGTNTPAAPQEGDLWMKSADSGILTYVNGAWVEYNKYTDDTLAQDAKDTADTAKSTADTAKSTADTAHQEVQNTVNQVDIEYYLSTSATELIGGNWSTTAPDWVDGKYIWSRQKMSYVDSTKEATYGEPACITGGKGATGATGQTTYFHIKYAPVENPTDAQLTDTPDTYIGTYVDFTETASTSASKYTWSKFQGADGKDGEQGTPGTNGTNGETSYLHIAYANSADGSTDFSTTDATNKKYMGQYVDFESGDSTDPADYKWTLIKGADGETGSDGRGIKSTTVTYQVSSSGTTTPTGTWTTSIPTVAQGKYLWTKTTITYTDDTTSDSYSVSRAATDGSQGVGIKSVTNKYAVSTSNTTEPTTWYDTPQTMTSTNKYLWNYEIITYTDNTTTETDARVIGAYGNTGSTGATGKGIKSVKEYYQVSTSNTTAPTTWSETVVAMTASNKYLWSYEVITYTDSTTSETEKRVIGVYGDKGNTGDAGRGISSTVVTYQASTNGTTTPTGTWLETIPSVAAGSYLWTRTIITYTDNTTSTSYSVGKMGNTGSAGKDGTSITIESTEIRYQVSTSGTTTPTGTWLESVPTVDQGKYLWTRTIVTYSDDTETISYSVAYRGTDGTDGQDGKDGTSVTITSKTVEYVLSTDGTTAPSTGWSEDIPEITNGKYLWTKTTVIYSTGEKTEALSVGYIGTNGSTGAQGEKGNGYVYIIGTQTASTASWTGTTSEITALETGTQILYKLPYAGKSNVTLNLTLADGSTTGAIACYFVGTTRLSTQYAANATIALMYDGTYWRVVNPYTNSNTYDRILYNNNIKAATAITASSIIVGTEEGYQTAIAGISFDIKYPVLWAGSKIAAGSTGKNNYLSMPSCTLRNNLADATLTQYEMVYLIGSVEEGIFTIGDEVFTTKPPREDYLPVEDDTDETLLAKEQKRKTTFFMPVGVLTSTYQIYFSNSAPELYKYGLGGFELYSDAAAEDLVVSTETQYCIGTSTGTPPAEDAAGWSTGLVISNINTQEYLWSRVKNTKKSGEVFYSEYSCLVHAQKEMINQVVEYLLWNDDQKAPGENEEYDWSYEETDADGNTVTYSGTNKWSITKPSNNIPDYEYLWSRIHSTYKYTGATVESLVTAYSDYKVDTSWNQLFSLTGNLRADVEQILKDIQGGYVKIQNGSILIGDSETNPLHLIIMNHNGIAFFDNPDGAWPSAESIENATSTWMIDGSLNMQDIAVTNLVASSIANQYLVLGNDNKNNADVSGDLDIYDRKGHIMFETILNSTEDYIDGFKVYKYTLSGTTMTPNGYIYLSRENGFREYDAEGKILFGNEGGAFTSVTNKTEQQVISKTEDSVTYGAQMVPMKITNAGDGLTHIGIAFLKL